MTTPQPRPNVLAIPAYVAGKPPVARPGLTSYKLSSNENPYPPLPGVLEAAHEAAAQMNRYPDMGSTALYAALGEAMGVPVEDLAAATGSVALIYQLVNAFCEPGDEVVYAWRSFEAYPIAVTAGGATSVQVPVTADGRHDLDAMAAAITDRTKVVIVCTPNNPTGPAVTQADLDAFIAKVPTHVVVVVDEAYPIAVTAGGATSVQVPVTADGRHDLDAMAAAITDRTKVVIVCTPNNPTGPAVTQADLDAFVAKVPTHVVVVVDEAYLEFVRMDDAIDGIATYRRHDNVVLTRTFSKAYGLAGFRVGYAVAPAPLAGALRAVSLPFGVSHVAQAAAIASLEAREELFERVEDLVERRADLVARLREVGWELPDAQGNFVWFPLGDRALDFAAACGEVGISVRPFAGDGVRVSIGEAEAFDRVVEVAARFAP